MKRLAAIAALAVLLAATATVLALRACAARRQEAPAAAARSKPLGSADLAPLRRIAFYRALIEAKALRAVTADRDGTLHVVVDLRAALEPRLAAAGLPGASALFPAEATGTIVVERPGSAEAEGRLRETWSFPPPSALLDLLDRNPAGTLGSPAMDAIPGAPSSMACLALVPSRLTDPDLGGEALASWRDRVSFAEKLLGRPLRAELAEDLAGPAIFALYEGVAGADAQAVFSLELKRTDRIGSLLDMVLALGALTERGTVRRYRGVATGSFASASGAPELAVAIDGPVLVLATSRERLESAIDARRAGTRHGGVAITPTDPAPSWSAVSASSFVAHGWARLARAAEEPRSASTLTSAEIRPEGQAGWRLTGAGPAPAITADPMIPFLRSALARRQRAD